MCRPTGPCGPPRATVPTSNSSGAFARGSFQTIRVISKVVQFQNHARLDRSYGFRTRALKEGSAAPLKFCRELAGRVPPDAAAHGALCPPPRVAVPQGTPGALDYRLERRARATSFRKCPAIVNCFSFRSAPGMPGIMVFRKPPLEGCPGPPEHFGELLSRVSLHGEGYRALRLPFGYSSPGLLG